MELLEENQEDKGRFFLTRLESSDENDKAVKKTNEGKPLNNSCLAEPPNELKRVNTITEEVDSSHS